MKHIGICDIGKVRDINQDAILAVSKDDCGLFVVADGMGGHSHGEKASQHIVQTLNGWWKTFLPEKYDNDFKRMIKAVKQVLEQANREIYHTYNKASTCGSTVAILFIYHNTYGILYAGDSRVYIYHQWKLRQITMDDIWENQSNLSVRERRLCWDYCHGKLLNAVGIKEEIECKITTNELEEGMVFLLCSDGLYKYCPERYLRRYMKQARNGENIEYCCAGLFEEVYRRDAKDNISIVMVRV